MSKIAPERKMSKTLTLTPALLRRIVLEEKQKILEAKKQRLELDAPTAEEVEADEYADTLAAHKDHTVKENAQRRYRNLTLEERRLEARLQAVRENKRAVRSRIARR